MVEVNFYVASYLLYAKVVRKFCSIRDKGAEIQHKYSCVAFFEPFSNVTIKNGVQKEGLDS